MFNVTLVNLDSDLRRAHADLGSSPLGRIDGARLLAILESFRAIDPVENSEAEPHIVIESTAARLLVRTGQGRLFVYNARDISEAFAELEPAAILQQLAPREVAPAPEDGTGIGSPAVPRRPYRGLAVAILVLALALDGYSIFSFFRTRPIHPPPEVTPISDPAAADALQLAAAGRYATGTEPGDRALEIAADGQVRFLRLTASGPRTVADDTYRMAKRDDHACLVTAANGLIDIRDIYTVVYYRDVYRRPH